MNASFVSSLGIVIVGLIVISIMFYVLRKYSAKQFYTSSKNDINFLKTKVHADRVSSDKKKVG